MEIFREDCDRMVEQKREKRPDDDPNDINKEVEHEMMIKLDAISSLWLLANPQVFLSLSYGI